MNERAQMIATYKAQAIKAAKALGYDAERVKAATENLENVTFAMSKGVTPKGFAFCFSGL